MVDNQLVDVDEEESQFQDKVCAIKLTSGEEIFAKVSVYGDDPVITLKHPCKVVAHQGTQAIVAWLGLTEATNIHIHQNHVVVMSLVTPELAEAWDQNFGSKLVKPIQTSLVLP